MSTQSKDDAVLSTTAGGYFFAPPEYFPDAKYAPLHIGKIVPLISN